MQKDNDNVKSSASSSLEYLNVLLIDDSEDDRQAFERLIRKSRFEWNVKNAVTISAGLEALKKQKFDCVFLDYYLPDGDAFSLLDQDRNATLINGTPFILLTAVENEKISIESVRRGAQDYLVKEQITPYVLDRSVQYAIERHKLQAEHKKLQDNLRQVQQIEAIGRFAGGIAHDMNNILSIISGYSQWLLSQPNQKKEKEEEKAITEIVNATKRAHVLIKNLLAFSQSQILTPEVLDLNKLTRDSTQILEPIIRADTEIIIKTETSPCMVELEPSQIKKVFLNLALNAQDAMPQGGRLTISTQSVDWDKKLSDESPEIPPGNYVLLSIADTGTGMDKATTEHVFEPFFTTKTLGMGLGLSMVYGIIQQSDGYIWVNSSPNKGTEFCILFPQINPSQEENYIQDNKETKPDHTPTILLAEDENVLRGLIKKILEEEGFKVLDAENGEKALTLYQDHKGNVDLVITDIVMPKMNGNELVEHLEKENPELNSLFLSGYTEDELIHQDIRQDRINFLPKPIELDTFLPKVHELLKH